VAYRIDPDRPLGEEIRRVLDEELGGAIESLRDEALPRDEAIHEARKHLKKTRALLRLARPSLGPAFAWENGACRDAARLLAGARDAAAMVETVARLRAASAAPDLWSTLSERLENRARELRKDDEAIVAAVAGRLRGVAVRLASWTAPGSRSELAPGAARVFASGRRRFRVALRNGDAEAFHAWRKRVKDLWYHARLLRELGAVVAACETTIDLLAEILGQRHDLDVLEQLLRAVPQLLEGSDNGAIGREIGAARRDLDARAALLGEVLFAGRTADLSVILADVRHIAAPRTGS
jgi:CHAD domain-containing protein